jgi:hypothetical protein
MARSASRKWNPCFEAIEVSLFHYRDAAAYLRVPELDQSNHDFRDSNCLARELQLCRSGDSAERRNLIVTPSPYLVPRGAREGNLVCRLPKSRYTISARSRSSNVGCE